MGVIAPRLFGPRGVTDLSVPADLVGGAVYAVLGRPSIPGEAGNNETMTPAGVVAGDRLIAVEIERHVEYPGN